MVTAPCIECAHDAGDHVVIAGRTIGVIVCPQPDCECELDPPEGLSRASRDFATVVRRAVQRGIHLL